MTLDRLGRYEISAEVGRGSMGVVYRGHDPVIDREVALKTVLLPKALSAEKRAGFIERFTLEARIAGKLIHPNIVVVHDAATDEESGIPFIAMEYVEGESIDRRIEREGRVTWREAISLVVPLARALDYAHEHGVVHRDIKPANLIVSRRGVPKITDFGIAKLPSAALTQDGTLLGTPYFMSPEQVRGSSLDGRSDLFCLAEVLYNLVAGSPPFEGDEIPQIFHKLLCKEPVPLSQLGVDAPAALDAVLARAMAKSPEERYPTGEDLARALEEVAAGEAPPEQWVEVDTSGDAVPAAASSLGATVPSFREAAPEPTVTTRPLGRIVAALVLIGLVAAVLLAPDAALRQARAAAGLARRAAGRVAHWAGGLSEAGRRRQAEEERAAGLRAEAAAHRAEAAADRSIGRWDSARDLLERSLAASRQAGDGAGEAAVLRDLAVLKADLGEWDKARADAEAALTIGRVYELPDAQAGALAILGAIDRDLGSTSTADELLRQAAALGDQVEDSAVRDQLSSELALHAAFHGRWEEARQHLASRVAGAQNGGQVSARVRSLLAALDHATGERPANAAVWEAVRQSCAPAEAARCRAEVWLREGSTALDAGDELAAEYSLDEAERQLRAMGHLPGLAAILELRAVLAAREDQLLEAERRLGELTEVRQQLGLGAAAPGTAIDLDPGEEGRWSVLLDQDPVCRRFGSALRGTPRTALTEARLASLGSACRELAGS